MSSLQKLKEQVWKCNLDLFKKGLVIYTFGNVSGIDRERGLFIIKPSGVPYEELSSDDMVVVDLNNKVVEGKLKPSSDTKTHAVLYRNFSNIGGIVHTHSTFATAWAQACKSIPVLGTTHADHAPVEIPCTDVMPDEKIKANYEEETGNQILDTFKNFSYEDIEMVLVAGHGPFTWGKTPEQAVYNSAVLEEIAKMALITLNINPDLKSLKQALIRRHFYRKHGKNAYYGQK